MKEEENKGSKDIILVTKRVYRPIQAVQTFSSEEKSQFIRSLLSRLSEKEQERWFRWVRDFVHPEQKWLKVERWMEGQFASNKRLRPAKAARMAVYYFKINSCMGPFFIKMAQRIKKRVRARELRAGTGDSPDDEGQM